MIKRARASAKDVGWEIPPDDTHRSKLAEPRLHVRTDIRAGKIVCTCIPVAPQPVKPAPAPAPSGPPEVTVP